MNPGIKTGPIVHLTLEECRRWITELMKALGPFAYQWECFASVAAHEATMRLDDDRHFQIASSYTAITVGDCRKAFETMMNVREEEMKPR